MTEPSTAHAHHHSHGPANRRQRVLDTAAPLFVEEPAGDVAGGVIVLHDVYGLTADVERYCRTLACSGRLAVAPYHYYDTGGPEHSEDVAACAAADGLTAEQLDDDVLAAQDYLVRVRGLAAYSVTVAGFGMGERLADRIRTERDIPLLDSPASHEAVPQS